MEEKAKTPVYKKWWFWVILGVVALAIIGGIIGGTAGGDNAGNSTTGGGSSSGGSSGGNTPTETSYYIGDTVTVNSLEVTVNSVTDTQLLGSELLGAKTSQNFIVITLTVKNTKNREETITSSFMKLKRGSAEYELHSGSIYLENGFVALKEIGSGIVTTITVAFEVPDKSTESEYILRVGGLIDNEDIVLKKK